MWNRQLWLNGFLSQAHPSEDTTANTEYEATPYLHHIKRNFHQESSIAYILYLEVFEKGEPGKVAGD